MNERTPLPPVVDNPARSRFETVVDGHLAQLVYRRRRDRLVLIHTEVPEPLEGRGIGSELAAAAVAAARAEDLTVVPLCPFVLQWLRHHPEEAARTKVAWPTDAGKAG